MKALSPNLVPNGSRSTASLQFSRDALTRKYGLLRKAGSVLGYDRLVLAPGVSFDDAYGLTQSDYDTRTPHAWRGGAQTTLLRTQVAAMRDGDTFVMTIPKAPYRCPPGPASVPSWWPTT